MLTTQDFLKKYDSYSDEELYNAYSTIDDYSDEAKKALDITINNKGGLESIISKAKQKEITDKEIERLKLETAKLAVPGTELSFLQSLIKSEILSRAQTNKIIEEQFAIVRLEQEDKKIKPRTIWGSIIGGGIASIIGGILWGLQMIQMHRIFYVFLIGLIILSYSTVRFFTKQSKKNTAVFVATGISVILALFIGQVLFDMIG